MQKKLFLILSGLLLLACFQTDQVFGQQTIKLQRALAPSAPGWSSPSYHPEIGDKIIGVNGVRVYDEGDFRREVRNSPKEIYLQLIDHRSGQIYHLITDLWPPHHQTRLGIYVRTSYHHNGVIVTGTMAGSPGMYCRYLKGEITPVHSSWDWWYD